MNCKPGDLAIIVRNPYPENVGKVIEVLSPFGEWGAEGFCWIFRSVSPLVGNDSLTGARMRGSEGFIADRVLRPISGVPVDEEQRDEVRA
jgi:hypothetical protein